VDGLDLEDADMSNAFNLEGTGARLLESNAFRALESYGAAATPTATLVASLLNPVTVSSLVSLTSASFTPPANAKLYYFWGLSRDSQTDPYATSKITDSVGSTVTELCASTPTHPFGAGYNTAWGASVSDTGATPAARTVTFAPFATTGTGFLFCFVVAVVNGVAIRSEAYGANSTSATLTLTASSAPAAANLSMYMFGVQPDTPYVVQPDIPGWTALANPLPKTYMAGAVFTKQGNTTAALTQTGLGSGISVTGGVILEIAPA
jgi:hypothetical protein